MNGSNIKSRNGDKKMKKILMSIAFTGLIAASIFAGPQTAYKNQQQRIAQGVKSGQLTPRETANLENKERAINGEVRGDKNANGGHLTQGERARVNAQHQNLSKQIYTDKHNAARDHFGKSKWAAAKRINKIASLKGSEAGV